MSATALPPRNPPSGRWTRFILPVYTALMILYLASPVLVMILYGFNDIPGERNTPKFWGFTLDAWRDPFGVAGLTRALRTSLLVAPASAIVATAIGTLVLGRFDDTSRIDPGSGANLISADSFALILAIAMAKLWKRPVLGGDNDPQAVPVAIENAVLNGVGALCRFVVSVGLSDTTLAKAALILGMDEGLAFLDGSPARGALLLHEDGTLVAIPRTRAWLA